MQMNVSLPKEMYDRVQEKVHSGLYSNASEVVRDALRRLDEIQLQDDWKRLNTHLAEARASGRSSMTVTDIAKDVAERG